MDDDDDDKVESGDGASSGIDGISFSNNSNNSSSSRTETSSDSNNCLGGSDGSPTGVILSGRGGAPQNIKTNKWRTTIKKDETNLLAEKC